MSWNKLFGSTVLAVLFIYLPLTLLPATFGWYRPGVVVFEDTVVGGSPELSFYREILVDSLIQYSVVVRNGEGQILCDAIGGPFPYKAQNGILSGHTLTDWAPSDPRCARLPVGEYVATTTWTVVRPLGDYLPEGILREVLGGILPPKYVTRISPVFHILPPDEGTDE